MPPGRRAYEHTIRLPETVGDAKNHEEPPRTTGNHRELLTSCSEFTCVAGRPLGRIRRTTLLVRHPKRCCGEQCTRGDQRVWCVYLRSGGFDFVLQSTSSSSTSAAECAMWLSVMIKILNSNRIWGHLRESKGDLCASSEVRSSDLDILSGIIRLASESDWCTLT